MEYIDIVLGLILAFGVLRGIWNGFIAELASLIALVVGIWAALKFSHLMRGILENHVSWNPKSIQVAAFILTFVLVVIGMSILAKILTKTAGMVGLGLVNKIMGAVAGLLKTVLLLSVFLNLFSKINTNGALISQESTEQSIFYNPISRVAAKLYPTIESWYDEWQQSLPDQETQPTSVPE
ncbi:MAG: CvpA family protein [Flavobacterium sp.]|nr:CvpA family protein [Flavobacterium sp.]